MSRKFTRRQFLVAAAAASGGAVLAGCGAKPTAVPVAPTAAQALPTATTVAPGATQVPAPTAAPTTSKYNEAPALKELVQQGKLPPVEQRLPEEPLVMPVHEKIGKYGGVWRRGFTGPADANNYCKVMYDGLVRYTPGGDQIVPHIAAAVEPSSDFTTWTIKLRKGGKWSDGQPLTADDIMFWYEDVLLNKDLTPALPTWMLNKSGSVAVAKKVDDYTVTITYDKPNTTFLMELANKDGGDRVYPPYLPAHYLKQFHAKYVPEDQMKKLLQDTKFDTWPKLFLNRAMPVDNPDRPVTAAWMSASSSIADKLFTLKRNPYFMGVDPEGNQLPYIDEVRFTFYADVQALNLAAIAGELDLQDRHIQLANYPVLNENQAKGKYRVINWPTFGGAYYVSPNLTHPDPELNKLFNNLDFRKALSIAIDRNKINELVWLGLGEPRQPVPPAGHPYYPGDEYAFIHTQYDPAEANRLLDSIGLKKGADGFRLMPDGKTPLKIEITAMAGDKGLDSLELVQKDWEAVGIKTEPIARERSLVFEMGYGNTMMFLYFVQDRSGFPFVGDGPANPANSGGGPNPWGRAWQVWYNSGGKEGTEPPDWIKHLADLHQQATVVGPEKQAELAQEINRIYAENLIQIGLVGSTPGPTVVNALMRNVPDKGGFSDFPFRSPGNTRPEQFYYE